VNTTPLSEEPADVTRLGLWQQWALDVTCVFKRDPAAQSLLEVLTTYPGVHAILIHRLSHRLWLANWRFLARWLAFMTRLFTNVDIHPGATIGQGFFIDHGAGVVIGETAVIGDDVTMYHGVTLGGTSWNKGRRHPTLGNGVLVGTGAKILGAITVGQGARVGANSVVVDNVPDHCTVVGIPGRIVRLRSVADAKHAGIDLNHHLIPDPVGKSLSSLLERIKRLEKALAQTSPAPNIVPLAEEPTKVPLAEEPTKAEYSEPTVSVDQTANTPLYHIHVYSR
jgi:serine O-acetyltransferase